MIFWKTWKGMRLLAVYFVMSYAVCALLFPLAGKSFEWDEVFEVFVGVSMAHVSFELYYYLKKEYFTKMKKE